MSEINIVFANTYREKYENQYTDENLFFLIQILLDSLRAHLLVGQGWNTAEKAAVWEEAPTCNKGLCAWQLYTVRGPLVIHMEQVVKSCFI